MPEPTEPAVTLYEIKGREIFATGTWHGDKYVEEDLDAMCEAFEKVGFKPPLKLGHSDKQHLLRQSGLPAAGWVDKIYRKGEKLLADFSSIPKQVYDLITRKAYDRVSSEIYWDYTTEGKKFPRVLRAVALLGAEIPEVTTLDSISALFYDDKGQGYKVISMEESKPKGEGKAKNMMYEVAAGFCPSLGGEECVCAQCLSAYSCMALQVGGGGCGMMNCGQCICNACPHEDKRVIGQPEYEKEEQMEKKEEVKEVVKEVVKEEAKVIVATAPDTSSAKIVEFEKKVTELQQALETERKTLETERNTRRREIVVAKVGKFVEQARISPAQSPLVESLYLAGTEEPIVVKFSDGEKNMSRDEAMDKFIELQPQFIAGKEVTLKGTPADDIDTRIKEYCKTNGLNYSGDGYVKALQGLGLKEV